MSVTAQHVNAAIKAKYSDEQWRVWFEVSQSTGVYSGRRADAVVMNLWPSKDFQMHVFEVKVSRGDFMAEMSDLTKWRAIGKYADFFWLATPVGLVDKSEVPADWGLMELTKGGLRVKKQAPAQSAEPIDRGFAASLLRSGRDLTEERISQLADERAAKSIEDVRKSERARFDQMIEHQKARADKSEEWRARFEEQCGVRLNIHQPPEKMAERLALASALEAQRFNQLAKQMRHLADLVEAAEADQSGG